MKKQVLSSIIIAVIVVVIIAIPTAANQLGQEEPPEQIGQGESNGPTGVEEVLTTVSLMVSYQARLADPSTGQAKSDGDYRVVFRLYDVESEGTALWRESKTVTVKKGVFSTNLGDTNALNNDLFNGQALWLGIQVENDAEALPRQLITVTPYAASLVPGAQIEGNGSPILSVSNASTSNFAYALYGEISDSFPGGSSTAVRGENRGTGELGIGVWGSQEGSGWGVYGQTPSGIGVYGYSSEGIGVFAHSDSGTALRVLGDAEVTGNLTVGSQSSSVPVAYGYVNSNGSLSSGTSNISSSWNSSIKRYEITISGESYYYNEFVTQVTLPTICNYANSVRTASSGGKLLVYIYNSSGQYTQCEFQFTTFKP
jgi:hypothetical protein